MENSSLPSASATVTCEENPTCEEVAICEEKVVNFPAASDVLIETEQSLLVDSIATIDPDVVTANNVIETQKTAWQKYPAVQVFLSTFLTIFLAELGDKTQVTTLLMAAESHQPWVVFAGAGTALVATSLIGVWLGCWLAKRVSAQTLEKAAGVLLLLIAAQLCWEVIHL